MCVLESQAERWVLFNPHRCAVGPRLLLCCVCVCVCVSLDVYFAAGAAQIRPHGGRVRVQVSKMKRQQIYRGQLSWPQQVGHAKN